jgi:phospholipase C
MGYYDERDLPYYYELASQYAMSDRFFSSILSATPPNRKFLFAGTSNGAINKQNPPPAVGEWTEKTIFQALNEKGISWKYYYQDNSVFLANYSIWNDTFSQGLVRPISEYYDILSRPTADTEAAQVIFIERPGQTGLDEHPLDNIQPGAANTKKIIDALMNSTIWQNSVFIYTYDEGGGLYDHVPPFTVVAPDDVPPQLQPDSLPGDFTLSGFRLPFIIVSPWVKPRFVSHVNRELTSILAFIEARFDVPPLTRRDAAADNMLEFFDFNSPARLTIPPLPSQPQTGTCSYPAAIEPGHPMN